MARDLIKKFSFVSSLRLIDYVQRKNQEQKMCGGMLQKCYQNISSFSSEIQWKKTNFFKVIRRNKIF